MEHQIKEVLSWRKDFDALDEKQKELISKKVVKFAISQIKLSAMIREIIEDAPDA